MALGCFVIQVLYEVVGLNGMKCEACKKIEWQRTCGTVTFNLSQHNEVIRPFHSTTLPLSLGCPVSVDISVVTAAFTLLTTVPVN